MKLLIFTFLSLLITAGYAQKNTFGASLELSPSFSTVHSKTFFDLGPTKYFLSGNVFAKGFYGLTNHFDLSLGIGFLSTKEFRQFPFGFDGATHIDDYSSHQYFVIPAGIRCHFGAFFLNPEIGLAIGIGHPTTRSSYIQTENTISGSVTSFNFPNSPLYNKVTVPLMLNFGGEVKTGFCKLLFGAKMYYSLNDVSTYNKGKYLGFGVMTGVKF